MIVAVRCDIKSCISFRSFSSEGESRTQTQLETAANAFLFPWTAGSPVEPSNPDRYSSGPETAIQTKIEVFEDKSDIGCELSNSCEAARHTSENEAEIASEVKTEDKIAARLCDGLPIIQPVSDSEQPAQEQSKSHNNAQGTIVFLSGYVCIVTRDMVFLIWTWSHTRSQSDCAFSSSGTSL